jgi:uncharacterized protein YyaL (SSP411 family)
VSGGAVGVFRALVSMPNRLAGATSPYLRQHADNPVDWHPWGEEALTLARRERKPILLSIGYSACHWCHVMAHESFEDPDVARSMNEHFVNIKVDREERPDLDQIYQTAHALLTRRSGGWPLTMFLTPDGAPYFGGTYFPKDGRYGLPGFRDILPRLAAAHRDQGDAIAEQSERLREALASLEPRGGGELPVGASRAALDGLKRTFDPAWGGFGDAPKFPHPAELAFCLRHGLRGDGEALAIVRTTLARMAEGGIHDQLGGGFCRYSVDAEWTIPHFEKMLYDNGPLLALFADVARIANDPTSADVARGIVAWMQREMRTPDGAYCASLDADSEGEEGKFYVWTTDEARALLAPDEFGVAAPFFGLDQPPNFEQHAWHLRVTQPLDEVAAALRIPIADAERRLAKAKAKLFAARARRVHPGRDDKVLTSWNALAIAGLARASRALDDPALAGLALDALDAIRATAWRDGRLFASRRDGQGERNAYLDDHAFLLAALVETMQTRFRLLDYQWACEIADALLSRFEDVADGGFWFTSHDHEKLFHRHKPGHDNATPSGNGVAAQALLVLGHLAADTGYVRAAERAARAFAGDIAHSPGGFSTLLGAIEDIESPPTAVLLAGDAAACARWARELERTSRPSVRVFDVAGVDALPPELAKGPPPPPGAAVAWCCHGTHCLPPIASLEALAAEVDGQR